MGREAVLILHGFLMNRFVMHPLQSALRAAGFDAQTLDYRSVRGTLSEHLAAVGAKWRELLAGGASRVHLIGHSMGGVIALAFLQRRQPEVGRAVLLGAPVAGCAAAAQLSRRPGGSWLMGESQSLWREALPLRIPEGVQVGAIAGVERVGLGALLLELQGDNDGVARVEETRLAGMADHLVLPVSHSGMLFSKEVARQCAAFLHGGRFAR